MPLYILLLYAIKQNVRSLVRSYAQANKNY